MKETSSEQTKECVCASVCERAIHFTLGIQINAHTYNRTIAHERLLVIRLYAKFINIQLFLLPASLLFLVLTVFSSLPCYPQCVSAVKVHQTKNKLKKNAESDKQQCHFIVKQLMRCR